MRAPRMPWIHPDNIMGRPFIRTEGGTKKWAEEIKGKIGKLAEGKIGVDLLSFGLSQWLPKCFPKAQFVDGKEVLDLRQGDQDQGRDRMPEDRDDDHRGRLPELSWKSSSRA